MKLELRAITNNHSRDGPVMMSSTIPSTKFSFDAQTPEAVRHPADCSVATLVNSPD
jgi:hypothetical protein